MSKVPSAWQRLAALVRQFPQTSANCVRFRVFFLLPRWFRMPSGIRLANRHIALQFPKEDGVDADFITCFLRNTYGLGQQLGVVRTILDIGANAGFFTLAARAHYPEAVIHAYEPNPRILPCLHANTAGLSIAVYPEAVSNLEGFVTMIQDGPSNAARTRLSDRSADGIRQISLRTAIERMGGRVDLLKLDCEGAEWEILRIRDDWEAVRHIRMEYHEYEGATLDKAVQLLKARGFRVIRTGSLNEVGGTLWATRA